jgi:hypothetical protein
MMIRVSTLARCAAGTSRRRRFLFAVVLVAASAPLSAFGQKSEEPQDCLHHALDDEKLKVVSLDDFNKAWRPARSS